MTPDTHKKKTVLVIEDELDMRIFLKTLLETSGYLPVITRHGKEGMLKAKAHPPDLIILDVMMPKQGGALTYSELRSDPELENIPVIMLSAVSRTTFFHYLKMINASNSKKVPEPEAYVEKPPDPMNLLKCVQQNI